MSDTPEAAFAQALAAFQESMPEVEKQATGQAGQRQTKYADLAHITERAMPALAKQGLSYTASPTLTDDGRFVLRYNLLHVAGHREGGAFPLPDSANSQQIGSAITYARRYCLLAVTGIAPKDDDDDGHQASEVTTTVRDPGRSRGRTTRTNGGAIDPAQPDEWTEVFTDAEWLTDARARLVLCTTPAEVRGLDAEAHQMFATKRLTADDAKAFKAEIDARMAEVTGQP